MVDKKTRTKIIVFSCLTLGVSTSATVAQDAGVEFGSGQLFPTIGLSVGYDDNIALSNDNEVSSTFYRISPGIRYQGGSRRNAFNFQYEAELGEYTETDFDDYLDHKLKADWSFVPSSRNAFKLDAGLTYGHDRRGDGLREFFPGTVDRDVDEFRTWNFDALYSYGAEGARGNLDLRAGYSDKEYRNNRDFTAIADVERTYYGGTFYWRVAPKTSLLLDVEKGDSDFPSSNRDFEDTSYGAGIQWDATAKTTGRIIVGHTEAEFDDLTLSDFSGSFWEASINWQPMRRTSIELASSKSVSAAFDASNYFVSREYSVAWRHQWPGRLVTAVDYSFREQDFDPGTREDEVDSFGISANYEWRKHVILGLGWTYEDRDSNLVPFDYDRNEILLSVEVSR